MLKKRLICFAVLALSATRVMAKNDVFSPILPLSTKLSGDLPLFEEAITDPLVKKARIQNDADAERLVQEIQGYKNDMATAHGERRSELIQQLFEAYAVLELYLVELRDGGLARDENSGKIGSDLGSVRREKIKYANQYLKVSRSNAEKARAIYHVQMSNYFSGSRAKALGALKKLEGDKALNAALRNRVKFLEAIHSLRVEGGGASKSITEVQALLGKLSLEGSISARLALAKVHAQKKNPAYRQLLAKASSSSAGLSEKLKQTIFNYCIAVWRLAEGAKGSYANPPLNMKMFASLISSKAIQERASLEDWQKHKEGAAIQKTKALAVQFADNPLMASFDRRILAMQYSLYLKTKNFSSYEKALLQMRDKYLGEGALGQGNENQAKAMNAEIMAKYRTLVEKEIAAAYGNISGNARQQVINLATRYLSFTESPQEQEKINEHIAALYVKNNAYAKGVAIYLDLAEKNLSGKRRKHLQLAIASQSIIAKWPKEAPWDTEISKGQSDNREKLLGIYDKLHALDKENVQWPILGHIGHLQLALNREAEAFKLWYAALEKSPHAKEAALAAGHMLVSYQKTSRWKDLERVARFCRNNNVRAMHHRRALDVNELFAIALFQGGKEALKEGQFQVAVKKLKEFVETFKSHKNRPEGVYLLANAYHGADQHPESISTMQALVMTYPKSEFCRPGLLLGGGWSIPMAYEENAIFFYQKFVIMFSRDKETPRVREALYELYMGRELYIQAAEILKDGAISASSTALQKQRSLYRWMRLEERYGSEARAFKVADMILQDKGMPSTVKAEALVVKGRASYKKGEIAALQALSHRLEGLGSGTDESGSTQDLLGEIRFLLAEVKIKDGFSKVFNLELKDPLGTLNKEYSKYLDIVKNYEAVCAAGRTSFCAPAMHRLARVSDEFVGFLEQVEINKTLSVKEVNAFNDRKKAISDLAMKKMQEADGKSMSIAAEGYTDPYWNSQILWQNSADWDFEKVTGETGNQYIQWIFEESDQPKEIKEPAETKEPEQVKEPEETKESEQINEPTETKEPEQVNKQNEDEGGKDEDN